MNIKMPQFYFLSKKTSTSILIFYEKFGLNKLEIDSKHLRKIIKNALFDIFTIFTVSGTYTSRKTRSIDGSYKVPNISAQSMIKYIQYNYIIVIEFIDILQIESGNFHQIHTYINTLIYKSL